MALSAINCSVCDRDYCALIPTEEGAYMCLICWEFIQDQFTPAIPAVSPPLGPPTPPSPDCREGNNDWQDHATQ